MIIRTIDINAREWFDKQNGNSYFSGEVILNFGLEDQKVLSLPFQYGYGDHFVEMGFKAIQKEVLGFEVKGFLYQYCKENNIILRTNKKENCLKREL
jgi:hypothetical protein